MSSSAISDFHNFSLKKKIELIKKFSNLGKEDLNLIKKYQKLPDFISLENNIGPFKIAANFLINGKDYFVPMEIEEPSVVAAASRGAKLIRKGGGFFGKYLENQMIGQIQLWGIKNFKKVKERILENKNEILEIANETNKFLLEISGGAKDLEVRKVKNFLVLHLFVDPKDAMGANIVNTMLEKVVPFLQKITGAKIGMRIISNFAENRVVFAEGKVPIGKLTLGEFSGKEVAKGILLAQELAELDIYRAVTHNKGVMNGIDAVALATGNDFRAIEAGVHSWALRNGKYKPITKWKLKNNFLEGEIKIPMAIATVGGATGTKKAKLALKILRVNPVVEFGQSRLRRDNDNAPKGQSKFHYGVKSAQELGVIAASVGLANNLAALSVLGSEGIQRGHLKLHQEFVKKIKSNIKRISENL